jgi:hypothetical protein
VVARPHREIRPPTVRGTSPPNREDQPQIRARSPPFLPPGPTTVRLPGTRPKSPPKGARF